MPRRPGRAAAKRAASKLESTPKTFDEIEDEPMRDVDASDAEPQPEAEIEAAASDKADPDDDDDDAVQAKGDDEKEETPPASPKSVSPQPVPTTVRRRRLGRPPKNRPPDWDTLPIDSPSHNADGTPRRRGRGGWRGRGGRKGERAQPTTQVIDKDGTTLDIVNDELDVPEEPEGETKVDKMGRLQDGREYRCRTFTVAGRGDRLYMLSTEPARCVGFRDSYLFFAKHKKLYKIIVDDEEKRDMIERDIIPHSYKGRSIGIVTARSVFREFGALIVVGGRKIIDDYDVPRARAEGAVEGEIADPNDAFVAGQEYNRNQYVAWHGASAVYHSNQPQAPVQAGKPEIARKRRVNVNDTNWQLEHAREASRFNAELGAIRRVNLDGVYDVHTNSIQYPAHMQPTRARVLRANPSKPNPLSTTTTNPSETSSKVFPQLDSRIPRNFTVVDTYMETPPRGISAAVADLEQRRQPPDFLSEFQGLGAVSQEMRDLLPPECRAAFDEAARGEAQWKGQWDDAAAAAAHAAKHGGPGGKRPVIIDAAIVPYSKA